MEKKDIRLSIKGRFFEVLDILKANKVIRGVGTFARMYNINKSNLIALRKNDSLYVNSEYIYYLVRDYGVNANWIITGVGTMFKRQELGLFISRKDTTSKARQAWKKVLENTEYFTEKCENACPEKVAISL